MFVQSCGRIGTSTFSLSLFLVNSPNDYCSIDLIDRRGMSGSLALVDSSLVCSFICPSLYDVRYLSPLPSLPLSTNIAHIARYLCKCNPPFPRSERSLMMP